ncbi:MAG: insulinase family protein [Pseudomonadota bacterium]|nr:insulinase family protein [Pseudomonadota bacterium]
MQVQGSLNTSTLKHSTQTEQCLHFTPLTPMKESCPARAPQESSLSMRNTTTGTLKNGLNYCLTSQPDAIASTAALVVASGSNSNPKTWPGLAHAVEHNSFVKNMRFKQPYEYLDFIMSRGGTCNAATSNQNTTYYFQLRNNCLTKLNTIFETHLAEGLNRLSASLQEPHFERTYVEIEKAAIDHEFHELAHKPWFETTDTLNQILNKEHPETQFGCGNDETLSDKQGVPLQHALEGFFKQHYFASNMSIAIHSPYTLDDQKTLLEHYFSPLEAKPSNNPIPLPSFLTDIQTPLSCEVKPRLNTSNMKLFFCIPSLPTALKYLLPILNNDQDASFKQSLRNKQLISDYEAYIERSNNNEYMLGFKFELSTYNLKNVQDVKKELFQFIKNIQLDLKAPSTQHVLNNDTFSNDYAQKLFIPPTIMEMTLNAAHSLTPREQQARPVRKPSPLFQIKMVLNKITEEKVIEIIENPRLESEALTSFSKTPFKTKQYEYTQASNTSYMLQLPSSDQYLLPTALMENNETNNKLCRLLNTPNLQTWHHLNIQNNSPAVLTSLLFSKKHLCEIQANTLYQIWNSSVKPISSKTAILGINLSLEQRNNNFEFKIKSAASHLPILFQEISELIQQSLTSIDLSLFQVNSIKQKQIQYYGERSIADHAIAAIKNNLLNLEYNPQKSISLITPENIKSQLQIWQNQTQINLLMQGCISATTAEDLSHRFINLTSNNTKPLNNVLNKNLKQVYLTNTSLYLPSSKTGYCRYIQQKNNEPKTAATFLLLSKLLSTSFFKEMRVNRQLGYSTDVNALQLIDTSGIIFTVEGYKTRPEKIEKEVNSFLKHAFQTLTPNRIQLYKNAVITTLKEQPNTLPHTHKSDLNTIEKMSSEDSYYPDHLLAKVLHDLSFEEIKDIFYQNCIEQPQDIAVLIGIE